MGLEAFRFQRPSQRRLATIGVLVTRSEGILVRLHINIDHVATLRNARGTSYPDPAAVAAMCERENIKLSLFIVADEAQVRQSSALGAAQIELHTGEYCHRTGQARDDELDRLRR